MRRPLRQRSRAGEDRRVLHRHGVTGFRDGLLLRCRSGCIRSAGDANSESASASTRRTWRALLPDASSTKFRLPAGLSTGGGAASKWLGAAARAASATGHSLGEVGAEPTMPLSGAESAGALDAAPQIDARRRPPGRRQLARAAALTVSDPSCIRSSARLVAARPHGAGGPGGGSVAVAELAHCVVEQAGAATPQIQPAGFDLGQVLDVAPSR